MACHVADRYAVYVGSVYDVLHDAQGGVSPLGRACHRTLSSEDTTCFGPARSHRSPHVRRCRLRAHRLRRRLRTITWSSAWCWVVRAPTTSSSIPLGAGSTGWATWCSTWT